MAVTDSPYISDVTASTIQRARRRLQRTWELFWVDEYVVWRVDRSGTWHLTTEHDARARTSAGVGKLHESGPGGPVTGEQVIHVESPYRFQTVADADIAVGDLLVINGQRLFRVDNAKRERADDLHMNVYLSELVNTELPS